MKRFLLSAVLLVITYCSFSATKTWIGASGSNWNNAANWSPAGIPGISDDVIFNTSGTVNVDIGSPVSLNSISIINNASVTFDLPGTKNFRLYSTSSSTPGFLIDPGCTFTFNASNSTTNNSAIDLTYAAGVTGSIYGTLILSNTGGASDGTQLITYAGPANYGVLTVYSGGSIKSTPNTQNTVSSLTPEPTIVMKSGSVYEITKNGGSFPEGTWETNSLAKALSPGTNGPTFNGSDYGNLEWNCPNQSFVAFLNTGVSFNNVTLISTGSANSNGEFRIKSGASIGFGTMTVNGNLDIGSDARLGLTSSNTPSGTGNGAKLILKGDLNNEGTIITYSGITTINELQLTGTSNQNISSTGPIEGKINTIMYNPAGVTLTSPVTLPFTLSLYNGKIKTTTTNILTVSELSTYAGASSLSFVEGPMRKIGGSDFTFPIGIGSIYAPLTYNFVSGAGTNDVFTAEYIRGNPQSSVGNIYGVTSNIDHISFVEYWKFTRETGSATVSVALTVNPESFCRNMSSTFISRYDPSTGWSNEGGILLGTPSPLPGSYESGTIRTGSDISDFGYFTLATSEPFTDNPLPINLLAFNATKISNTKAMLDWELAQCCSSAAKFELEKAGKNQQFSRIATIGGSETNRFYSIPDNNLKTGVNYYRLKMTDADGTVTYSRIVAVLNGAKDLLLTAMPTIITNDISLIFTSSGSTKVDILVVDLAGRVIRRIHQQVHAGNTGLNLSLSDIQNGPYLLYGQTENGKTNVIRFIKQSF